MFWNTNFRFSMKWLTLEGKHVINELSLKCLNNFALKKADFKT